MTFEAVNKVEVGLFTEDGVRQVGQLAVAAARKTIFFEYDAAYVENGVELSPFRCPLVPGPRSFDHGLFEGLPGLIYDSLPDGWGRLLLDRQVRKQGVLPQQLSPLDRLVHVGQEAMGALVYSPSRDAKQSIEQLDLDGLARDVEQVLEGHSGEVIEQLLQLNGSSGGARPKAVIGVDQQRQDIVYGKCLDGSNYEPWLVKFPSSVDTSDAGAIEYVYAKMALDAGIQMENIHLFPSNKSPGFFATKRFDRDGDRRIHCHSVCGLLHSDFRTPALDYQDLIRLTTVLTKDVRQSEKMFRLAVFNVLAHNRDDHSKNFSFCMEPTGEWRLSPAYDLTFSSGLGDEQSTMVLGKGKDFQTSDLLRLGSEEGFPASFVQSVIDQTRSSLANWFELASVHDVTPESIRFIQQKLNEVGA